MLSENLAIRLYRDRARVQVDYVLYNTGEAVDVRAGFPSLGVRLEDEKHEEIEDYSISADGQNVPFSTEKGDPTPLKSLFDAKFKEMGEFDDYPPDKRPEALDWLVSTVHFGPRQRRHIHIEYDSLYAYCTGGYSDDSDDCDDRFAYVLSTGAAWKGPIVDGKVTIQPVRVDASRLIVLPTGRFQRSGDEFIWTFHNLKPTTADDIVVNMNDHSSTIASYDIEAAPGTESSVSYYIAQSGRYSYLNRNYTPHSDSNSEDYPVSNVANENPGFEWRASHSPGIGETITLSIIRPAHIDDVGLVPGCGQEKSEWFNHARIKAIDVTVNGKYSHRQVLPDEFFVQWNNGSRGYDWITLPTYTGSANEIRLTIRDVYPGKNDQTTCISQVVLRKWLPSRPTVKGQDGKELP